MYIGGARTIIGRSVVIHDATNRAIRIACANIVARKSSLPTYLPTYLPIYLPNNLATNQPALRPIPLTLPMCTSSFLVLPRPFFFFVFFNQPKYRAGKKGERLWTII